MNYLNDVGEGPWMSNVGAGLCAGPRYQENL